MANGDKTYNVGRIRELTRRAAGQGAEIVCFHECSVTASPFSKRSPANLPISSASV